MTVPRPRAAARRFAAPPVRGRGGGRRMRRLDGGPLPWWAWAAAAAARVAAPGAAPGRGRRRGAGGRRTAPRFECWRYQGFLQGYW